MPAEGIKIVDRKELLTYKEMYRITRVLSELGVNKLRLTGGEPFVRKDFMQFLESLQYNQQLQQISITSNGVLLSPYISRLEAMGIHAINLSIDSLQEDKFATITRRNVFHKVMTAFNDLNASKIQLKLNIVVQAGFNTDEIKDFVALAKDNDLSVRFIEEMPFNGNGLRKTKENWDVRRILQEIESSYPELKKLDSIASSTSINYSTQGFKGTVGIIPAFTRSICHDCNRIRITATGLFKNCLFDDGVLDLKPIIRGNASDDELKDIFRDTILKKPKNGFVAEANRGKNKVSESMSTIGG